MKILIAYDGSRCADEALQDLEQAGLEPECDVRVLSVADVFIPPPVSDEDLFPKIVPDAVERARARSQEKLDKAERFAKRAGERIKATFPNWEIHSEARADSPAWAVVKEADEWKPDLIVLGARGLSAFGGRFILGSISQRVLYEARCSVRIARAQKDHHKKLVRILIGVDNSPDSNAAVDAVLKRTWPGGSEVGLLAVVDTVMAVADDSVQPPSMKWIDVSEEENWPEVRKVFEPQTEKLRKAGLHVEVLIRRGNPADELIQEAHSWGADCIFVGARGTRGIDRLLLGSVSSAVAARAHCSVEVVRPKS